MKAVSLPASLPMTAPDGLVIDEHMIRRAIRNEELFLSFQPKVDASGHWPRVVGYEALVRWMLPDGTLLMPDRFIPVAERSDVILDLDLWVLETACRQARSLVPITAPWRTTIAINVSSLVMMMPGYAGKAALILQKAGVDPRSVILELTETAALERVDIALVNVRDLSFQGVNVALDDFGTGYSSFSFLQRLPVREIKIDQSFVSELPKGGREAEIVRASIAMAHALGMKTVAEGVETAQQAAWLRKHGCDMLQGYLFGKPAAL